MHISSGTVVQSAAAPGVPYKWTENRAQNDFIFIGMECDFCTDVQCIY